MQPEHDAPMPDIKLLVSYAAKAPSGHNTQPWTFRLDGSTLEIHPDYQRQLSVVDPDNRELFISLGCATENIALAAEAQGFKATVNLPRTEQDFVRISFRQVSTTDTHWLPLIDKRQSNRNVYIGDTLASSDLDTLRSTQLEEGVEMRIFNDPISMQTISHIVLTANAEQLHSKPLVDELLNWMRLSKHEVAQTGDGLSYAALAMPPVLFRGVARKLITSPLQTRQLRRTLASASAFLCFGTQANNIAAWIQLGRSFERVVLTATSLGLAHSHYNQPFEGINPRHHSSPLDQMNNTPCLLIRIGHTEPSPRAPRRPLADVFMT